MRFNLNNIHLSADFGKCGNGAVYLFFGMACRELDADIELDDEGMPHGAMKPKGSPVRRQQALLDECEALLNNALHVDPDTGGMTEAEWLDAAGTLLDKLRGAQ